MNNLRQAAEHALAQLEINRTNFRKGPSKSICKMLAGGNDEVIAKLRAALAEQQAKDHKDRLIEQLEETVLWQAKRIAQLLDEPQPAKREPLTNADLKQVINAAPTPLNPHDVGRWVVNVCRAIEAAHGITGQPQSRREVEFTDEEIGHAAFSNMTRICKDEWVADDKQVLAFARAVIAAYKAKQEKT